MNDEEYRQKQTTLRNPIKMKDPRNENYLNVK